MGITSELGNTKKENEKVQCVCVCVCARSRNRGRASYQSSPQIICYQFEQRGNEETPGENQGKEPSQCRSLFRSQLHLTKNFPGFGLIEKSHDDSGILTLQSGDKKRTPEGCLGTPEGLNQVLSQL
jgi:hypothetical protein